MCCNKRGVEENHHLCADCQCKSNASVNECNNEKTIEGKLSSRKVLPIEPMFNDSQECQDGGDEIVSRNNSMSLSMNSCNETSMLKGFSQVSCANIGKRLENVKGGLNDTCMSLSSNSVKDNSNQ